MQCWLDLISDFIYLFFYTFLVEWENCVFPRFFARPVITTSTSGSFQPPQELLELQEESSLRTMLCKMWPNWEFTMEPLTSHFGTWSKWKHWHALYCLQSSEKKYTLSQKPFDNCLTPQMTFFRCYGRDRAGKQIRQRGIGSAYPLQAPCFLII